MLIRKFSTSITKSNINPFQFTIKPTKRLNFTSYNPQFISLYHFNCSVAKKSPKNSKISKNSLFSSKNSLMSSKKSLFSSKNSSFALISSKKAPFSSKNSSFSSKSSNISPFSSEKALLSSEKALFSSKKPLVSSSKPLFSSKNSSFSSEKSFFSSKKSLLNSKNSPISPKKPLFSSEKASFSSKSSKMVSIPSVETGDRLELYRAIECSLGSAFSSNSIAPNPSPLILVISGPSGVGKDAIIRKLRDVRKNIHFVVTATTRAKRVGEIDGKDYFFMSKEEFLSMVEKDEFLEYALVYGDYKGIPKNQIREYMAKGCDIVLRVDIQGAATLKRILGNSAVFIFLVAESESELVKRLIDRRTESKESLMVRVATAREEIKHMRNFDYVVVNAEGKLDGAVDLVESIIDAEKAKVRQRTVSI